MQVHPTRTSVDLAIAAMLVVLAGLLLRESLILAWGGALLVGLAIARAVTALGVARIRGAGFEMLWLGEARTKTMARGETIVVDAEIRNRDSRAARFVALRAVCAPELRVSLVPTGGEVPAGGRLRVALHVHAGRVGRFGIHGLSLEVQGSPGLYEVPLTFANPFGFEVLPHVYRALATRAPGGRARRDADRGHPGPFAGDGEELRELREHRSGDPFRRIAWKATARRGKLMVRDYEREERDVVWLVLDASLELSAGEPGLAPLDRAIDELGAAAGRHVRRGDRVGLAIVAARTLAWIKPERGPEQLMRVLTALSRNTGFIDADRSGLDEADIAARVLEHMRPLDPATALRMRSDELDRIARRAERLRARAPFPDADVFSNSRRDRHLRRYCAAFGIGSPARFEPERPRTDAELAAVLTRIRRQRPRPSLVYVWSPTPDPKSRAGLLQALGKHARKRSELRWVPILTDSALPAGEGTLPRAVREALSVQARIVHDRGALALKRLGISLERITAQKPRLLSE